LRHFKVLWCAASLYTLPFGMLALYLATSLMAAAAAIKTKETLRVEFCVARSYETVPKDVEALVGSGPRLADCAFAQAICADVATHGAHQELRDNFELAYVSKERRAIVILSLSAQNLREVRDVTVLSPYDSTLVRALLKAAGSDGKVDVVASLEGASTVAVVAAYDSDVVRGLLGKGYKPVDCQQADKDAMRVMLPQMEAEARSLETSRVPLWLWSSRFALAMRKGLKEAFDQQLQSSRVLPKCVKLDVVAGLGQRLNISGSTQPSSNGAYFVQDVGPPVEACEAIVTTSKKVSALMLDRDSLRGVGPWPAGTSLFIEDWQVFVEVTGSEPTGAFSAKVTARMDDEDSPKHECFEKPQILDRVGCEREGSTWDRRCVYDAECPFFTGVGEGGGCVNGYCELPVGVRRLGYRSGVPGDEPMCLGCPDAAEPRCCGDQQAPRYAFS